MKGITQMRNSNPPESATKYQIQLKKEKEKKVKPRIPGHFQH